MEPIKINIEVSLNKQTLAVLERLIGSAQAPAPAADPLPEAKTAPTPAPQVQPEQPAVPAAEDDDDLPPSDAPSPKKTPTEDDARQAVKAARSRGVAAKTIKDLMKDEFNIASSVECPAERRQELIDALNKLAA